MNPTCSFCGRSVAPGSGLFVNRIPDVEHEARLKAGRPFPDGDFVCCECTETIFTPSPSELAQEILERLGGDPAEVIYSVNRQDVANTLAEKLLEGEVDLDALSAADLESLFQAGVAGVEEIEWQPPIRFRLDQAWDEQFYRSPDTEDGEGPLVEQYENAARLGDDGWLESAYEDRYNDNF